MNTVLRDAMYTAHIHTTTASEFKKCHSVMILLLIKNAFSVSNDKVVQPIFC